MLPLLVASVVAGQDPALPPDGVKFSAKITRSYRLNYLASVPEGYDDNPGKRYPLIVFLHGAGERGDNLEQNRIHGPFKELAKGRKFPFIIVAPQCPAGSWWEVDVMNRMLRDVEKRYRVDRDRIYLTGLSMGGFGTWAWATAEPKRFAAIFPICGGGDPTQAARIAKIPTWVVHGDADGAVNVSQSINMVNAIKAAGGNPRFDIIKGGGHDVWTDVYKGTEIYDWFLTHKRGK